MNSPIPSAEDINVYNSLDEQAAVQTFLGKTLEQAESLFRENFSNYGEDLMHMGPKAFCFYVQAAMNYLCSDASDGDSDAVRWFCTVVDSQVTNYPEQIAPAVPALCKGFAAILARMDRYECDIEIDGDVPGCYRALLSKLGSN